MIASLAGRVERSSPGEVVMDVGGVGYRLYVPLSTYAALGPLGRECRLRVVTVVREDEISLFGFATEDEEDLFRLLQAVSGVGPRLALKILSGLNPSALRKALGSGDHRMLTAIPGVGKKLAQRMVVELRDKVGLTTEADIGVTDSHRESGDAEDVLQALEALGYPRRTAQRALETAQTDGASSLEERVREALRTLAPRR